MTVWHKPCIIKQILCQLAKSIEIQQILANAGLIKVEFLAEYDWGPIEFIDGSFVYSVDTDASNNEIFSLISIDVEFNNYIWSIDEVGIEPLGGDLIIGATINDINGVGCGLNNCNDFSFGFASGIPPTETRWMQSFGYATRVDERGYSTNSEVVNTYVNYREYILPVPEPTSLALLGLGLAGFGFARKKKKS